MKSERIPLFEASLQILNVVAQMYQELPYMNFPIGEGPKSSYMSGLADTGSDLNLVNLEYQQAVADRHPNIVFKFDYLKDLDDVDP